jgi:vesicle-associated membrane protein 7
MTDQGMGYRIPFAFLIDVANRFRASYGERAMTATANSLNDTFSRTIQERMDYFSNDRNADKINKVKGDIEEAKNVMVQNIEKVLARGEKYRHFLSNYS